MVTDPTQETCAIAVDHADSTASNPAVDHSGQESFCAQISAVDDEVGIALSVRYVELLELDTITINSFFFAVV